MSRVGTIVVAAGASTRAGGTLAKQFAVLGARPMFVAAVEAVLAASHEVIVVAPPGEVRTAEDVLRKFFPTSGAPSAGKRLAVVPGGPRRQDSVREGLSALSPEVDVVLVHDAARPFASKELAARVAAGAEAAGACGPAVPVPDTVKRIESGEDGPRVVRTLDRSLLRLAQTPQGFRRSVLEDAYRGLGDIDVTDDASAVEMAGHSVVVVDGEPGNVKITTAEDLEAARVRSNLNLGLNAGARIGEGFDCHRLVEGRDLVLCGVRVPFDRGLEGYSDADVATHALADAILGAAARGDIGRHVPPGDPRFKDISSIVLLRRVVEIVREQGYAVGNADVTIIAEEPKLAPFVDDMRRALAEALGVGAPSVSVKATTTEGTGPEGRGEVVSSRAIVVLRTSDRAQNEPVPS